MFIHCRNKVLSSRYLAYAEGAARSARELLIEAADARLHEKIPGYVHHVGERTEKWAPEARQYAEFCDQMAEYFNLMERFYRRRADRPWIRLPPLPPIEKVVTVRP
jgi:hypothetical protein